MNIITIFDNILLSNNINIEEKYLNENNIKEILMIELDNEQINCDDNFLNINKITFLSNPPEINFDYSNNILLNFLSNSSGNILIVSKNNLMGFIIIIGFCMKYLKISLLDCIILGINKNITGIDKSIYINHLHEYHIYLKNNNQ